MPAATDWRRTKLGAVAQVERMAVLPASIRDGTSYVGLEHLRPDGAVAATMVRSGDLRSTKFAFSQRHVLYGKLRPYLRKVARPDFAGVCSTDILPILPGRDLDRDFLFHYLRQPTMVSLATARSDGVNLPRVSPKALLEFPIALPPLAEQRRIAGVLDNADSIRRKRRKSLRLLDEFLRSAFLEVFGDPVRNERGWDQVRLRDLLAQPLRNGLSPAKGGRVTAQVLTLTAITGSRFEPAAVKTAQFVHPPHPEQIARPDDFLICRGNGNRALMGRARFPRGLARETIFPDTIIAARVDTNRLEPAYLEAIWVAPVVRRALEAASRTTSGIHKVNQKVLESIRFPLPVVQEQKRYAALASLVERLRQRLLETRYDDLFDSLAQRAFRGQL